MKRAILHIGLPKTASTSFQTSARVNRRILRAQNADYFQGWLGDGRNHPGLYLASLRSGIHTLADEKHDIDKRELRNLTKERISVFLSKSRVSTHIFSSEGLSFLRTDVEIENLKSLFPIRTLFRVIFVERDKAKWLESWKRQILGKPGRQLAKTSNSTMYVEPDTWLTDFEGLKETWSRHFDDFTCLQYTPDGMVQKLYNAMGLVMPDRSAELRIKDRSKDSSSRRRLVERA